MVTAYYISKLSSKRKIEGEDYYSNLIQESYNRNRKYKITCRVCLQEGTVPIYGKDDDIPEALITFGDIQINEDDEYPQYLCDVCYKFIKTAILFRKTAKESEETLKEPMKEEMDNFHDYDYSNAASDVPAGQKWGGVFHVKVERKGKVRYVRKVTCGICKKVINRSYIKQHITMHDPNHRKYVCETCGKAFRLRCAYYNHSLRHRNDFPHKCKFCPYKARYGELLKIHMRTHTGDYRYMCTECPARFIIKSNLNNHILKQHREPQFKCDACKRSFHTKQMLERHYEADHLGIKNHVCPMCGKAFGYRNAMMKHQRHVHKREKLTQGRVPSYLMAELEQNKEMGNL